MTSCTRCLLNTDNTKSITFDKNGICNYCSYYDKVTASLGTADQKKEWLNKKVEQIKEERRSKEYDCILGVSGGVDSTYMALWAKECGLRPLVVHFDNGWNSELATQNIRNICEKLNFSLKTYVINWEEFKRLQIAYLKAGVIDIEALTDHAIMATIYKIAEEYKIKYTLSGFNYSTEAIMPKGWVFDKGDWDNIKDIYAKYGSGEPIRTFPHVSFYKKLYYHWFLKLESIQILNYLPYNKQEAKKIITEKLSWRDYGGKHYESVFTKFYQAYILPQKFGVDKRIAHLSNLICSGQISKENALQELKLPLYTTNDLEAEKNYVLKKLDLSAEDFEKLMKGPVRSHQDFKTEKTKWEKYFKLINILKFKFK